MSSIVTQHKLIKSDVKNNNNKVWYITQYDDNKVIVEYGRVGDKLQTDIKDFSSEDLATKFLNKKLKEKTGDKKGYTPLKVINGGETTTNTKNTTDLLKVALEDIESSSPDTANLIRYLSKANIHNILSSTTMTYDESAGTFKTPCGIVTEEGITEARDLLNSIYPYVETNKYSDDDFIKLVQNYIQIIPRKVGRKLDPKAIFPNLDSFDKEHQLLDALLVSLNNVVNSNTNEPTQREKVFDTRIEVVTDKDIIDHITKMFESTKNSIHTSSKLKVKKVYSVTINGMKDNFDKYGAKMKNVWELWHGTRTANVLSIMKSGLVIPKSNAGHVTGRMFGDGIYFSDQSTKSLNYSQGYWSGGSKDNNCFMFIADVAMGDYYVPNAPLKTIPSKYDSCYAQANKSSVRNNEMIVYRLDQCNLKYLVEFSER